MTKFLLSLDTDQIKAYVFGTNRLKEIRGASSILDRLNRIMMPERVGGETIYANGGSGLFKVDQAAVQGAIQSIQQAYREETDSASITAAYIDLPDEGDDETERRQMDLMNHRLRIAKDQSEQPLFPPTHPLFYFCDSCGRYYAEERDQEDLVCRSCLNKRQENERVKAEIERWTTGEATPDPASERLWERLLAHLGKRGYPISGYSRPEEFDTLGKMSKPRNYMGLIYADGDGMGGEIKTMKSLSQFADFAQAVDQSVYQSVEEAIAEHLTPDKGEYWPFDILLLGGDDLVMVTQAQSAIEVALSVVERFPALTAERYGKPLTLSASVVLAHVNYPFNSLLKLAESGLKFAKQQGARRRLRGETFEGGLLNFLVVSSANHVDFSNYYKQTLKKQTTNGTLYRSRRPYTAAEMRGLLDKIRQVNPVPRTKLEQLRSAVFKSREQGTLETIVATLRLRNKEHRQALFDLVGHTTGEQVYMPWQQQGADWVTPVLDVVELIDFVGRL